MKQTPFPYHGAALHGRRGLRHWQKSRSFQRADSSDPPTEMGEREARLPSAPATGEQAPTTTTMAAHQLPPEEEPPSSAAQCQPLLSDEAPAAAESPRPEAAPPPCMEEGEEAPEAEARRLLSLSPPPPLATSPPRCAAEEEEANAWAMRRRIEELARYAAELEKVHSITALTALLRQHAQRYGSLAQHGR